MSDHPLASAARIDAAPDRAAADRAAAADLSTFFDASLDLLCIRDAALRFVRVNPAWEAVLGWTAADLEGRPMLDFIHPDDTGISAGHMQRLAAAEGAVVGFTNRYRRRDGTYRHLEWQARRVGDLVYGVARDVTERLAIAAEMVEAKAAAEAANQAKSDFLANMSHEIRTPLNGVIGVAAALARTPLNAAQKEMVELIESSGVTLERLVSDVLDFSKIEAGRLTIERHTFDLRDLDGVVEMFRLRAVEKGLAFPVEIAVNARGEFVGDCLRIKQVLSNLLSNAVKFTLTGEVRLSLTVRDPVQPDETHSLVVDVEDTGVGFARDFAQGLFQRFRQADGATTRRFGGSGLGLSITHALVGMMDGQIEAVSELGRGSRFQVILPLPRHRSLADYDAGMHETPLSAAVAEAHRSLRLDGLRVLLAEDHPVNRRVVQLILEPFGVALTTVENGAEAVERFAAGDFDLVLMDMQMPVMDGLAATLAIREHESRAPERPRTPIVMLSANAMREHQLEGEAAGADSHIAKPVTAASLTDGIIAALDMGTAPPTLAVGRVG